ncbi:single-stranded DNA-binding protein [Clostridioides sp. GD02377]|uniref:single-stranded DNA-binding protein n=1 Tax=unclassified Clostridioides TaxID=2635829 RepID=UPI00389CCFE2
MNIVILLGEIDKDSVVTNILDSDKQKLEFIIKVKMNEYNTEYFLCEKVSSNLENLSNYLVKGKRLVIKGNLHREISSEFGVDKELYKILVNSFEFLPDIKNVNYSKGKDNSNKKNQQTFEPIYDDDIPF